MSFHPVGQATIDTSYLDAAKQREAELRAAAPKCATAAQHAAAAAACSAKSVKGIGALNRATLRHMPRARHVAPAFVVPEHTQPSFGPIHRFQRFAMPGKLVIPKPAPSPAPQDCFAAKKAKCEQQSANVYALKQCLISAAKACNQSLPKASSGLGASDPFVGIDPCYVASLPACLARASMTSAPAPAPTPQMLDEAPTPAPDDEKEEAIVPNFLMWGGIALLVVAAGGYVVYKSTR